MARVALPMECLRKRSMLNRTASAFTGVPSVNFMPLRILRVQLLPSFDCSHDSTSHGTTSPLVVRSTRGSETWLRMLPLWRPVALCVSKMGTSVGMPMTRVSLPAAAGPARTSTASATQSAAFR